MMIDEHAADASTGVEPAEASRPARRKRTIFEDKVVRIMALAAIAIVIFYLMVIVWALVTGVLGNAAPKTIAEKGLTVARAKVDAGSKQPLDWAMYAQALIDAGQYSSAQSILDKAKRAKIEDPRKQWLGVTQVRLLIEKEEYAKAVKTADQAMDALRQQYIKDMKAYEADKKPTSMTAEGLGANYYAILVLKATALEEQAKVKDAIEALTFYLDANPTAADIAEWRGDMYASQGENAKAIADFKSASRYTDQPESLNEKIARLKEGKDK